MGLELDYEALILDWGRKTGFPILRYQGLKVFEGRWRRQLLDQPDLVKKVLIEKYAQPDEVFMPGVLKPGVLRPGA